MIKSKNPPRGFLSHDADTLLGPDTCAATPFHFMEGWRRFHPERSPKVKGEACESSVEQVERSDTGEGLSGPDPGDSKRPQLARALLPPLMVHSYVWQRSAVRQERVIP